MKNFLTLLVAIALCTPAFGQMKAPKKQSGAKTQPSQLSPVAPLGSSVPAATPVFGQQPAFRSIQTLPKPVGGQPSLKAHVSPKTGTAYLIQGDFLAPAEKSLSAQVADYLAAVKTVLRLEAPESELQITGTEEDQLGFTHLRLGQFWMGVPVHGAEAVLHKQGGKFYLFNGRYFPSPTQISDVAPAIAGETAAQTALDHVGLTEKVKPLSAEDLKLMPGGQTAQKLVIYFPAGDPSMPKLAWHVTVVPNITARYAYFVDAKTGEILHHHSELCKIAGHFHGTVATGGCSAHGGDHPETAHLLPPPPDGPYTANANDLFGQSRQINTYSVSNTYFLIDASQSMFNSAQSNFPNEPVGVIWTIDAENTSPENNDFGAIHVTSSNNNWSNAKAVTAHYHAERAYDYFKNTFNRNSINGVGGNIVSLINVVESDGSQMDNAFWNGEAMFYGNGNQAFNAPLAKALDVAGHEMSHGVVQATANLEYLDESGALNESFADIFGAMIDRDDWQMGEDVTNSQFFPTGALRDLSDPHNGGSSLNDNGWQPAHYSERYTGGEDNGGVHINSGIPNKAFFLFATSIGKEKAEQVFYRALSQYLTKSSNFVDCRNAVVQAATDLHGANSNEVNAAKSAFDAVGIGAGSGSNNQTDIGSNPGEQFVLMTDTDDSALYIFTPNGDEVANPLTETDPLSRPSVTDDGSAIVFVDSDNRMRAITVDWSSGATNETIIQNDPVWTNVAISKDGSRLAALTTDNDDRIHIYDFALQQWQEFQLYNPTTAQGGTNSYNVVYADVLEWDVTGQWVMYDALSNINNTSGEDIEYWDIGFIYVWAGNGFGNGHIEKLFSSLPENVSVGDPTFSKNSDYIIAFDYFDEFNEEYYLLASNIETGDVGTIFQSNDLTWPNYSTQDNRLVFNAEDNNGTPVLAFINVAGDKITPSGNASVFIEQGRQGVWFANGDRVLGTNDLAQQIGLKLFPNPVNDQLSVAFETARPGSATLQVFDLIGRLVAVQPINLTTGTNRYDLNVANLPAGQYFLRLSLADGTVASKFAKG